MQVNLHDTLEALAHDPGASENERALALKALERMEDVPGRASSDELVDAELSIACDDENDLFQRLSILSYAYMAYMAVFYIDGGKPHVFGEADDVSSITAMVGKLERHIREGHVIGGKRRNAMYWGLCEGSGQETLVYSAEPDRKKMLYERLDAHLDKHVMPKYIREVKVDKRSLRSVSKMMDEDK